MGDPRTLSAAIKRLSLREDRIRDLEDQLRNAREWGGKGWDEATRLGRIMTYRWNVNDAHASCPHSDREIGKVTGNIYCVACRETLNEVNAHLE